MILLVEEGGVINMAYLEFKIEDVDEHYWLQDPVLYNKAGESLFLIRVGCHTVDMCIPYYNSMNGVGRIYKILKSLGLKKEVIRIDPAMMSTYIEDCIFIRNEESGSLRKGLVFTMKVRKAIPLSLPHTNCGIVYHPELFGKNERIYPSRKEEE